MKNKNLLLSFCLFGITTSLFSLPMEKGEYSSEKANAAKTHQDPMRSRSKSEKDDVNDTQDLVRDEIGNILVLEEEEQADESSLKADFRNAIEYDPLAARFVIASQNGVLELQPREQSFASNSDNSEKAENRKVNHLLRSLIVEEYPSIDVEGLFNAATIEEPLSAEKVHTIFAIIDEQEVILETLKKVANRDQKKVEAHYQAADSLWNEKAFAMVKKYELKNAILKAEEKLQELKEKNSKPSLFGKITKPITGAFDNATDKVTVDFSVGFLGIFSVGVSTEMKNIKDAFNKETLHFSSSKEEQLDKKVRTYKEQLDHINGENFLSLTDKIKDAEKTAKMQEEKVTEDFGKAFLEMGTSFLNSHITDANVFHLITQKKGSNFECFKNQAQEAWKARVLASQQHAEELQNSAHPRHQALLALYSAKEQARQERENIKKELENAEEHLKEADRLSAEKEKVCRLAGAAYSEKIKEMENASKGESVEGKSSSERRDEIAAEIKAKKLDTHAKDSKKEFDQALEDAKSALQEKARWELLAKEKKEIRNRIDEQYQLQKKLALRDINRAINRYFADIKVGMQLFGGEWLPLISSFAEYLKSLPPHLK